MKGFKCAKFPVIPLCTDHLLSAYTRIFTGASVSILLLQEITYLLPKVMSSQDELSTSFLPMKASERVQNVKGF